MEQPSEKKKNTMVIVLVFTSVIGAAIAYAVYILWYKPRYATNSNVTQPSTSSTAIKNTPTTGATQTPTPATTTPTPTPATTTPTPTVATVCPVLPNYEARPDVDVSGGSMATSTDSLSIVAATCSRNPACVAFNNLGTSKSALTPITSKPGQCLYVKLPTVCPAVAGYTPVTDADNDAANNLNGTATARTLAEMKSQCDPDIQCDGFNAAGFMKRVVTDRQSQYGSCLYVRDLSQMFPGFRLAAQGGDMPAITEGTARALGNSETVMSMTKIGTDGSWVLISPTNGTWGGRPPAFPHGRPFIGLQFTGARAGFEYRQAVIGKKHRFMVMYAARQGAIGSPALVMGVGSTQYTANNWASRSGERMWQEAVATSNTLNCFVENRKLPFSQQDTTLMISNWWLFIEN